MAARDVNLGVLPPLNAGSGRDRDRLLVGGGAQGEPCGPRAERQDEQRRRQPSGRPAPPARRPALRIGAGRRRTAAGRRRLGPAEAAARASIAAARAATVGGRRGGAARVGTGAALRITRSERPVKITLSPLSRMRNPCAAMAPHGPRPLIGSRPAAELSEKSTC